MAKKDQKAPEAQAVLFPIEGHVASRTVVREVSQNSDHLRKVDLDIIRIRPGFNPRSRNRPADMKEELYEQSILIPDLADKIHANNGPAAAIIGDIHEDGKFYITDGERRFRAPRHLVATGRETFPNGKPVAEVFVILNPPGTTDADRKKKAVAANDNLPLTPIQLAKHYLSFKEEEGWSHEQIAEECKVSRQMVDNYIIAATKLSQEIQDKIDAGEVKMTNAVNEYRRQQAEKKPKANEGDEQPIVTGALEEKLKEKEKAKDKLRGDEDEFEQQDNSITGSSSKGGPGEDRSSNAVAVGRDTIYFQQQRENCFKQFINRYHHLQDTTRQLIVAEKPSDEEDELKAAELYEKRQKHIIQMLMNEYDITVK